MQLHRLHEVEHLHAEHTFRTPPWGMLILPTVLAAICIATAAAVWNRILPSFFWVPVGVVALLIPLILSKNFFPTLRSTNWVLRVCGERIYIMLRNYRNPHDLQDGPIVLSLSQGEIASVGEGSRAASLRGSEKSSFTERYLEIRLKEPASVELCKILEEERSGILNSHHARKVRSYPSLVSVEGQTLRVLWNGQSDVVKPSLKAAVLVLGRMATVHNPTIEKMPNASELDDDEFLETLRELCRGGNQIAAIKLLRERRGCSLREAKQIVDDLAR